MGDEVTRFQELHGYIVIWLTKIDLVTRVACSSKPSLLKKVKDEVREEAGRIYTLGAGVSPT